MTFPDFEHELPPEDEPGCNGICLDSSDIGFLGYGIAVAHPDCPKHGHAAAYEVDGTPRRGPREM